MGKRVLLEMKHSNTVFDHISVENWERGIFIYKHHWLIKMVLLLNFRHLLRKFFLFYTWFRAVFSSPISACNLHVPPLFVKENLHVTCKDVFWKSQLGGHAPKFWKYWAGSPQPTSDWLCKSKFVVAPSVLQDASIYQIFRPFITFLNVFL